MAESTAHSSLVRIRDIAKGGAGVGHVEPAETTESENDTPRTWFVEGALPGELVRAQAFKEKKRFVRARAIEIVEPSEDRVSAPCPVAEHCGGCDWQHVRPSRQAHLKQEIVKGQLRRLRPSMDAAVPSDKAQGYRRRARLHYRKDSAGVLQLGFLRRSTHEIEDHTSCLVLEPVLDQAVQQLRTIAAALPPAGEVHALSDGERVVLGLPGIRPDKAPMQAFEELVTEGATQGLVGIVLRGARKRVTVGRAELAIDGGRGLPALMTGPFMFSQAQADINRSLIAHVARVAATAGKDVLELYAGAGNFTRRLAAESKSLVAVDDSKESIAGLRRMASQLSLKIEAKASKVDKLLPTLVSNKPAFDVVVLDPPRGGVGVKGAASIARLARQRIVYISCDPATLNRDLEAMIAARPKLKLRSVRVFDMMPMTSECETVAWLEVGK